MANCVLELLGDVALAPGGSAFPGMALGTTRRIESGNASRGTSGGAGRGSSASRHRRRTIGVGL
jgi:hypothetical protein